MAPNSEETRPRGRPIHRYLALAGRAAGGPSAPARGDGGARLPELVAELNRALAADDPDGNGPLAAGLVLTVDRELLGLLFRPAAAVDVLVRTADVLHPDRLAWGLGAGELTTDPAGDVSLLEGPCLARARSARRRAEEAGAWAGVEGLEPPVDRGLSALLRLMGALREGWTDTQARYAGAVRGRLQKEVAERFGVSPSAVSESLKAARWRDLVEAEEAAREMLRRFAPAGRGTEPPRELNPAPGVPEYLA